MADEIHLEPIERERVGRLRAELELAELRHQLARERFEQEVSHLARGRSLAGTFVLDYHRGVLVRQTEE